MLFLLSEKEQYSLPVYMTFMQAKDSGLNILKGEKYIPGHLLEFFSKRQEWKENTFRRI